MEILLEIMVICVRNFEFNLLKVVLKILVLKMRSPKLWDQIFDKKGVKILIF